MKDGNIHYRSELIEQFYRTHRTRWDQFYESERTMLSGLGLGPTTRVLDIGCGCGGLGLAVRERFGVRDYTGVDINRQAVETAARMNSAARFVHGDVAMLSGDVLAEEDYDLVASLGCIDWNVRVDAMLEKAYRYVRPGGYFLSSFRLTTEDGVNDMGRSYQYINFDGRREGEVAPYVVFNGRDLLSRLCRLAPRRILGYGYWGMPSATAVTPFERVCFAVLALEKSAGPAVGMRLELELPGDLMHALEVETTCQRKS